MSLPLVLQGIQTRVTQLEASAKRCDHADRLDVIERDVININNSVDVLRMGMGRNDTNVQFAVDNVVIASLRGAVDGLSKREFVRATELAQLKAQVAELMDLVPAEAVETQGEGGKSGEVAALTAAYAKLGVEAAARYDQFGAELIRLRAMLSEVGRTAVEHARAGRADIDALKREIEHLKASPV